MPEQMITIAGCKVWPEGNITVKDHQGRYLKVGKSCNAGIENMQGMAVIADISVSEYNGKSYNWLNGWKPADGRQPMTGATGGTPQPPVQPAVHVPPPPPKDDRTNSIIAQALCKTVTFASVQDALAGYQWLLEALSGEVVVDPVPGQFDKTVERMRASGEIGPDPVAHAGEPAFDDDIPF